MCSGAAKTHQAFGGCSVWAAPRSQVMSFCRTSEHLCFRWSLSRGCSGLDSHSPPQSLFLGCPAARVWPAGASTAGVCVPVICCVPGEAAPVECTAQEPGLLGMPATRESTARPKGTIPAPSSIWWKQLVICQAEPSATESSPALHEAGSQFRLIKSQRWKWNGGKTSEPKH